MTIRTRFAPSPTGFLHIGGLRTALYAYLFAKKHGGVFMLRIEDTDQERFVEGGIENILSSLAWAGLAPDEGVVLDAKGHVNEAGDHGPYVQSKRLPIYAKYIHMLLDKGHAYYCFCSAERLSEVRKNQEQQKQPTGYDGHCRNISETEVKEKLSQKIPHVIRMKMPKEGNTSFVDSIRGEVTFQNELVDDQVLIKTDGFPTYHFAVVVDDHLMETTHVIRGEEWISSTPKHLMLYQMFGWTAPTFAHLSLIVNEQKQKLSKRHGDVSVEDFKQKGYLPEAIVNFIAFLGWNPGDEREIFRLPDLEKEFSFDHVGKTPAVFNREKLNWYNQQYIRMMDPQELVRHAAPYLVNAGLVEGSTASDPATQARIADIITLQKERITTFADVPTLCGFLFAETLIYEPELLVWKKSTKEEAKKQLEALLQFLPSISDTEWNKDSLEQKIGEWIQKNEYTVGSVLWPMRVALSGEKNSPGPYEIAAVLGKEKTLNRLKKAHSLL